MISLFLSRSDVSFDYDSLPRLTRVGSSGGNVESGDIGFYLSPFANSFIIGHSMLVGCDPSWIIHSVTDFGVYSSYLDLHRTVVFFRFKGSSLVAQKAAAHAFHWSRGRYRGEEDFEEVAHQRVGYSRSPFKGLRAINAALGFSNYGSQARARLEKYQGRLGFAPKSLICSELAILAYQLAATEKTEQGGFIKLDAKHSIPGTLMKYLGQNAYWDAIGRGKPLRRN